MSYQLHNNDCLAVMRDMPDNSVSLIIADPPYFRVKDADWDNAWASVDAFLDWLRSVVREFARILQPNGSLYLFAWPRLASRIELMIGESLNVLNHLVWHKTDSNGHVHSASRRADKEQLRGYVATAERVIFAEQDTDWIRQYLRSEWERAGLGRHDANIACGTASIAGGHYFVRSQWCLPTAERYASLQRYANRNGGDYLQREYEDLRRPFNLTKHHQWGDVMTFAPVASYPGKHPCEKPQAMLMQFVEVSSRPDSVVLDPFMGSGATGLACHALGREFIGIDASQHWYDYASRRLEAAHSQMRLAV